MKRKRIYNVLILSVILAVLFCACGELEFEEGVQISIESSSLYQEPEIQSAIDVCVNYFNTNFVGCTLITISYDEELCMKKKMNGRISMMKMKQSY